jgi:hypothetical protein
MREPIDRRAWAAASVATFVVVVGVRLFTSRGRTEYAIWPDEPAQLAIARLLGGGTRWNMDDHSVWRPLYGALLSPVYRFTDDPTTVLRVALGLNAVLGGVAAMLLLGITHRLTRQPPPWCAAAAVVVSLAPAVVFTTDFVFAESLVAPLYLATTWLLMRFHESPTIGRGVAAGVLAAAAFATHSRMLPLAVVVLGATALAAYRRRLGLGAAAIVGAVALAGLAAASLGTRFVVGRLWDEPSTRNSIGGVVGQLLSGPPVLVSAVGQLWYLLVATLGMIAYGTVVLARAARGAPEGGEATPRRSDARVLLVTVGALVALSIVFMADRWRSDQLVYGRYNDAVVGPIVAIGVLVVFARVELRRFVPVAVGAVSAILAGAGLLWVARRDDLATSNGIEPMILGLQPFATSPDSIDVVRIALWAAPATALLALLSTIARTRALVWPAIALTVVMLAVGWARTAAIVDDSWFDAGGGGAVAELRDGPLADGVAVDFYLAPGSTSTNRMMLYQFHLPRTEFTVVNDIGTPGAPLVFARVDGDGLAEAGATIVWRDPRGRYALWRRPDA